MTNNMLHKFYANRTVNSSFIGYVLFLEHLWYFKFCLLHLLRDTLLSNFRSRKKLYHVIEIGLKFFCPTKSTTQNPMVKSDFWPPVMERSQIHLCNPPTYHIFPGCLTWYQTVPPKNKTLNETFYSHIKTLSQKWYSHFNNNVWPIPYGSI